MAHNHGSCEDTDHSHAGHGHAHQVESKTQLAIVLFLTLGFAIVEIVGGLLSGSLALLADAGHMITDSVALFVGFFAAWLITKRPTKSQTFGFRRAEILGALINGILLVTLAYTLVSEAIKRFDEPYEIESGLMLSVAVIGLLVNILGARILLESSKENLNAKAAFYHVIGDMLGSVGAIFAAIIIFFTDYYLVDVFVSLGIVALILFNAFRIIRETVYILMEAAPSTVNLDELRAALRRVPGVISVHDLHIWTISSNHVNLSAHVLIDEEEDTQIALPFLQAIAEGEYNINHTTFQIEKTRCESDSCGPPKCDDCTRETCQDCPWASRWEEESAIKPGAG